MFVISKDPIVISTNMERSLDSARDDRRAVGPSVEGGGEKGSYNFNCNSLFYCKHPLKYTL